METNVIDRIHVRRNTSHFSKRGCVPNFQLSIPCSGKQVLSIRSILKAENRHGVSVQFSQEAQFSRVIDPDQIIAATKGDLPFVRAEANAKIGRATCRERGCQYV